jgi:hypothetical protein
MLENIILDKRKDIMKMFRLWSILEEWVIGDGNYPHFRKNDKVNLAFYVEPYNFDITKDKRYCFEQIKYFEYNFCGKIIFKRSNIIVIDTNYFKFYMELNKDKIKNNMVGKFIQGKGKLLVDYYVWAENIGRYKNQPDIFYNLIIEKIHSVKIPEKFINRFEGGTSFPGSLKNEDINDNEIIEIEKTDIKYNGYEFFVIEFSEIDEKIKMTFV